MGKKQQLESGLRRRDMILLLPAMQPQQQATSLTGEGKKPFFLTHDLTGRQTYRKTDKKTEWKTNWKEEK